MAAYYNEIDLYAAQWLRNLIAAGHIADGVVDTRSIEDVHPADLQEFTQCHFFAGVGVWSLALRNSSWSDDRPVWTGSCPCQPFSAAGQGAGFADERHLWPAFGHLIAQCKPAIVLGEQVASKDVDVWIDLVHADLEALGYAFGSVPFPSAGVGAPHIRDRNYWVANAKGDGHQRAGQLRQSTGMHGAAYGGANSWLADPSISGRGEERAHTGGVIVGDSAQGVAAGLVHGGADIRMADTECTRICGESRDVNSTQTGTRDRQHMHNLVAGGDDVRPSPTNGFWRDADWLGCTDGKWRPVEPGTFPLAHGAASRVGRLRAYGNAINAEAARVWVETVMESL